MQVKWTAPEVTTDNNDASESIIEVANVVHIQAINYFKYSSASDVWSFGCVMYEIWSLGHEPFKGHVNREVLP